MIKYVKYCIYKIVKQQRYTQTEYILHCSGFKAHTRIYIKKNKTLEFSIEDNGLTFIEKLKRTNLIILASEVQSLQEKKTVQSYFLLSRKLIFI